MPKTPEEIQREKSRKEALAFDKQRFGSHDSELTEEEAEKIRERRENQQKRENTAENAHLEKFTGFDNNPLAYLHSIVGQGEFANRDQRTHLYNLITLIKIEQSLKELVSLLSKKK